MLYKEIIERKKLPIATFLLILLCIFIYIYKFVSMMFTTNGSDVNKILGLFFVLSMIVISLIEIYRSSVRYKYSIIADQFIIHKIIRNSNVELENVKFKDIKFIGKTEDLISKYKISSSRKYLCSLLNTNRFCCVYSDGTKLRKFYFEPSDQLITKLKLMMSKDECCAYIKNRVSISI